MERDRAEKLSSLKGGHVQLFPLAERFDLQQITENFSNTSINLAFTFIQNVFCILQWQGSKMLFMEEA